MKVLLSWIKDFVDVGITAYELADRLTMAGLEVISVQNLGSDAILEVDLLPNRADCWSVLGISREIAAVLNRKLKIKKPNVIESKTEYIDRVVKVEVRDKNFCPRYMARLIKSVRIESSPNWLKNRLELSGIRSINNVVDITNYLLLELGQPMHAFDFGRVVDRKIIVRKAEPGEKIITLDGIERTLDDDILCIADTEKAIALAGVMGGDSTEVTDATIDVLLESAYFNPQNIHKTSKKVKFRTESSIRFERGVDWQGVEEALDRAAEMIKRLAGGEIFKGKIDIKTADRREKVIRLRPSEIKRILGFDIPLKEISRILQALTFKVVESGTEFFVTIPTCRAGDIEREIDIIEEISRIYGYHKIISAIPKITPEDRIDRSRSVLENAVRSVLVSCGFFETNTFSLVDPEVYKHLRLAEKDIRQEPLLISNPLSRENSALRTLLLPSLLQVLAYNLNRQQSDPRLFEIGRVFIPSGKDLPVEKTLLAAVMTGSFFVPYWKSSGQIPLDFSALKGILEILFESFNLRCQFEPNPDHFLHPGKSAKIFAKEEIGYLGQLHPEVVEVFGITQDVFVFEIELEKILPYVKLDKKFKPIPKFPAVRRDVALTVPPDLQSEKIVELIQQVGRDLVEEIVLFDRYSGSQVGQNAVSLAYSITYRSSNRTLTLEEVNQLHQKISEVLVKNLAVKIR